MKTLLLFTILIFFGCNVVLAEKPLDYAGARKIFATKIVKQGKNAGAPDLPPGDIFQLIRYKSPVGKLAAYLTKDPEDGKKHPAIVWITGGDNNSIGDVWSARSKSNDQSASAFRKAGVVMMFPSQRGGNDNPGKREGFYGEADDILAATNYLAKLPYVDPKQIYLGGHSTGGTMAMLVGEYSDRYRAIFALGPVATVAHYGGHFIYHNPKDENETIMRSPAFWLDSVKSPMYVFEGANDGNWDSIEWMKENNKNHLVQFFKISGHNHFSIIDQLGKILAKKIIDGKVELSEKELEGL